MRLLWLFLGLAVLFLTPFLIWGGSLEATFSLEGSVAWLQSFDKWAWLAGILLLMGDLFLPIPGTVIMSALGLVYGTVLGGLIAFVGSFLSGALSYGLCRMLGRGAARRLLGAKDLEKGERLFSNVGGWIVVMSRWLPLFPEVVACMAGLTRMPATVFLFALACGSLPLALVFAAVGQAGSINPMFALILSAGLPAVLWLVVSFFFKPTSKEEITEQNPISN